MNAQVGSGIARGFNQLSTKLENADLRKAQTARAQAMQQQSELQLQEYKSNAPMRERQNELQMQQLEQQAAASNGQALKAVTVSAFDRFEADGSVRHLNTWLEDSKKNPVGAKIWSTTSRYDKLTKTDSNDKLLLSGGYNPDEVYGNPDISDDLIVVTETDGNQLILPKETMYAVTGYTNYLDDKQLGNMERKARINQMMRTGQSSAKVTMQERVAQDLVDQGKASSISEAYGLIKQMDATGKGTGVLSSTEERAVEQIMESENVGYLDGLSKYYEVKRQGGSQTDQSRFIEQYNSENPNASSTKGAEAYRNLTKTSTQKEVGDVKELRLGLDEMNWLDSSVGDMSTTERSKIYRDYISPLEDLRDFKMSTDDKRTIRNLRNLTALGNTAGTELTTDETGLLDSTLNSFKKYVFNEVGGKKATTSYETFRNVFRNALYGASLTDNEIKSFNKAAGTLGEKFQPVMQALQTQMKTIKNNLEAIRDLNDPDIAHYYTGQSIEEIDSAIESIDDRLNDPRLQYDAKKQNQSISVQRTQKEIEPTEPTVESPAFDFDAAMREQGI